MNHCEITVRVPVVNEMQLLFASEPCEPLKPRFVRVVFLVEKDVRVERRRTCDCHYREQTWRQNEISACPDGNNRNEEVWSRIAFIPEIRPRDEMVVGIVDVVEVNVVAKNLTAPWMVSYLIMYQRLTERHHQMRSDGDHEK
jgi:hypothetical protein